MGDGAVIVRRFEIHGDGGKDVGGGHVGEIEGGEFVRALKACDAWGESFEFDSVFGAIESKAGEDSSVCERWDLG